jgi:L-malate glycosyltransferase
LGGILEVIEDEVTGFAVDSRDHIKLSTVLHSLFSDPERYAEFSANAKKRLKMFRDQKMKEKMNEIINHKPF